MGAGALGPAPLPAAAAAALTYPHLLMSPHQQAAGFIPAQVDSYLHRYSLWLARILTCTGSLSLASWYSPSVSAVFIV